jgi:hypothetical protein
MFYNLIPFSWKKGRGGSMYHQSVQSIILKQTCNLKLWIILIVFLELYKLGPQCPFKIASQFVEVSNNNNY